ncbi:hypothetical protein FNV43_RR05306 [Rhamnella rubrinervis]|uniref:Uncharacterized protein n=1 Tax=Rhamnella rubrinervis TaxID=2594499 RepID=A0A8K0HNQ4_9ROSA|nr:hypothetical protein FNV43_RR05306 [Rhamnella rubrinervis]
MDSNGAKSTGVCHILAVPYPGRGHINPVMNLCNLLASKSEGILVTFVVTEEWLGLIGSQVKPDNIRFASIPNVVPSEKERAADMPAFLRAVRTQMEAPFERLLDELEPSPSVILADYLLAWAVGAANRRNIKMASFLPISASMFSVLQQLYLYMEKSQVPVHMLGMAIKGMERLQVESTPGADEPPPAEGGLSDLPSDLAKQKDAVILQHILEAISCLQKVDCVLFPTIYELESDAIDALRAGFKVPVYTIGPAIPYSQLGDSQSPTSTTQKAQLHDYFEWLDCQPRSSVLYVSFGSFLEVSGAQMEEIAAGLKKSGVRFLWVARGETDRLREECGENGLVVPWCDQLRVLCHPCVGGFWSHCGWNSIREGIYAGVPFLCFPIGMDQNHNAKLVVEDWKVGWRVRNTDSVDLVNREEIAGLVQRFMDLESEQGKEMRKRATQLQQITHRSAAEGGSSDANINAFLRDISHSH